MERENFYKLLVNVLSNVEKKQFFFSMSKEEKINCLDINHIITSSYLVYKIHLKNTVLLEEKVKDKEKHDFIFYKGNVKEFENNNIIGLKRIKDVLTTIVIEYPYLTYLYKIIEELFIEHETGILNLTDEEICYISNVVNSYAFSIKKEENKLNIQRKRNRD